MGVGHFRKKGKVLESLQVSFCLCTFVMHLNNKQFFPRLKHKRKLYAIRQYLCSREKQDIVASENMTEATFCKIKNNAFIQSKTESAALCVFVFIIAKSIERCQMP